MSTGLVLNVQRMSTEDGPGLRTTVFLKGCPLACAWCHNPESIARGPEVVWFESRCIGCGSCVDACPEGALGLDGSGVHVDRERCRACGTCVEACPAAARELLGRTWTVEALVAETTRDRAWFGADGGVTVSGGEPTMQPAFAADLLAGFRAEGVHTALDTCGLCAPATLDRLLPRVDLLLYDLKLLDPVAHARHTGRDNGRILENLRLVRDRMETGLGPGALWIRTPLVPGSTATPDNVAAIGAFLARELGGRVDRWELCAFNNLCRDQYRRLDRSWAYGTAPLLSGDEVEALLGVARRSGFDPARVLATGPTRMETS